MATRYRLIFWCLFSLLFLIGVVFRSLPTSPMDTWVCDFDIHEDKEKNDYKEGGSVSQFDDDRSHTRLSNDELARVYRMHRRVVSYESSHGVDSNILYCPDRYLFVNTHTYGRHHNQLQEMMNIILWAERFNRTAVLGWFRVNESWVPFSELYNSSLIEKRYCVISASALLKRLDALSSASLVCFGHCLESTPLQSVMQRMYKVRKAPFPSSFAEKMVSNVMAHFIPELKVAQETIAVVGGEYGFKLRGELFEKAAVNSLLLPAERLRLMVDAFFAHSLTARGEFFGVHKRHREKTCRNEFYWFFARFPYVGSAQDRQMAYLQCNISLPYLSALHTSLGMRLFDVPLFIAHDGQDNVTLQPLLEGGARVYDKEHYPDYENCLHGLCPLAVDYFVLREGRYYTGNVLSSVSQNVCFARLGQGMTCHGMQTALLRIMP